MPGERFDLQDVHPQPDYLHSIGLWEWVVFPNPGPHDPGWVRMTPRARETLGEDARAWIVEWLNREATRTSFGVMCAEILRRPTVPDPPPEDSGDVEILRGELQSP